MQAVKGSPARWAACHPRDGRFRNQMGDSDRHGVAASWWASCSPMSSDSECCLISHPLDASPAMVPTVPYLCQPSIQGPSTHESGPVLAPCREARRLLGRYYGTLPVALLSLCPLTLLSDGTSGGMARSHPVVTWRQWSSPGQWPSSTILITRASSFFSDAVPRAGGVPL